MRIISSVHEMGNGGKVDGETLDKAITDTKAEIEKLKKDHPEEAAKLEATIAWRRSHHVDELRGKPGAEALGALASGPGGGTLSLSPRR